MSKRYAVFSQSGVPQAFYAEDIHGERSQPDSLIPDAAVEISAEDWRAFVGEPGAWVWQNGKRQPAPEPPLEERIARAMQAKDYAIRAEGSHRLRAIVAPYSDAERESWHKQEKEARAWLADDSAPTPMLTAIAAARGISLEDMVLKVMQNVEAFEQASGAILGQQQKLLDDLAAAQSLEEIEAVAWPQGE